MIALLDANVLIALADSNHVHAASALRFFKNHALRSGWATCPLTENAFLRIFGGSKYPGGPGRTATARQALLSITSNPGHQSWSDDASLLDTGMFPNLPAAGDLTDLYLLALAVRHGGRLVTLDRRIDPAFVKGGAQALEILTHA